MTFDETRFVEDMQLGFMDIRDIPEKDLDEVKLTTIPGKFAIDPRGPKDVTNEELSDMSAAAERLMIDKFVDDAAGLGLILRIIGTVDARAYGEGIPLREMIKLIKQIGMLAMLELLNRYGAVKLQGKFEWLGDNKEAAVSMGSEFQSILKVLVGSSRFDAMTDRYEQSAKKTAKKKKKI